jgi:hypothetical protein
MLTTHTCCIASSSGNYDQLDDELTADPLRVTLFDADEKKLWSSPLGAPEGTFSVASTGGRNMLCITNGIEPGMDDDASQEADRTVGLSWSTVSKARHSRIPTMSFTALLPTSETASLLSFTSTTTSSWRMLALGSLPRKRSVNLGPDVNFFRHTDGRSAVFYTPVIPNR